MKSSLPYIQCRKNTDIVNPIFLKAGYQVLKAENIPAVMTSTCLNSDCLYFLHEILCFRDLDGISHLTVQGSFFTEFDREIARKVKVSNCFNTCCRSVVVAHDAFTKKSTITVAFEYYSNSYRVITCTIVDGDSQTANCCTIFLLFPLQNDCWCEQKKHGHRKSTVWVKQDRKKC